MADTARTVNLRARIEPDLHDALEAARAKLARDGERVTLSDAVRILLRRGVAALEREAGVQA